MKLRTGAVLTHLLALSLACPAVDAGSIWAKASRRTSASFTDDIAAEIGDVLTIVIAEHSVIENETNRSLSKTSSRDYEVSGDLDLLKGIDRVTGKLFNIPKLDFESKANTDFDGGADFDSDRSVTDKITVTVEDVLPNGNLVVLGKRQRDVGGDKQIILVSGIVRPSDISLTNQVSSGNVANFHVVYKAMGRENQFTKPGWLDALLNFVNPF